MSLRQPISFIIPAYNCAETVGESVESIINGNFSDGDEIIIVDDCSTDSTPTVLERLKIKYPQIQIIRNEQNRGCPASRNVGIQRAKNLLLFNLDSDNILVPGSIEKLQEYMTAHGADVAAFGAMYFFKRDTRRITHKWVFPGGVLTLADFLAGPVNPGPGGNFLYTKASWEKVGKYWEYGAGLHEAWGFSLKQLANGSKFVIMPDSFYYHRHGHSSLFVREAKLMNENLMAGKMIESFMSLISDDDAAYIKSEAGARSWFTNLSRRPIRLKTGEAGKTGRVVYSWPGKFRMALKAILRWVIIEK